MFDPVLANALKSTGWNVGLTVATRNKGNWIISVKPDGSWAVRRKPPAGQYVDLNTTVVSGQSAGPGPAATDAINATIALTTPNHTR